MPLAYDLRPQTLDDIVGQTYLIGPNRPLRRIIESKNIPNMIFYGPPGVGKTTIAQMIANYTDLDYHKLNGTTSGLSDIKEILDQTKNLFGYNGILLYLDEIQYFNKKQQQSLLEYVENGKITLIASTTENPFFYIHPALLSRSIVFEFKSVTKEDIKPAIIKGFNYLAKKDNKEIIIPDEVIELISINCGGDVRKALNVVDMAYIISKNTSEAKIIVDYDIVKQITYNNGTASDRDGDYHFDVASGLMKSIRGSDPDAAIFYLAKLLNQGDLMTPIRRILCSASEDIGLAHPQAITIAKACCDSALQLGLPEARLPLAHAVIYLATLPKSNSAYIAINSALEDVKNGLGNNLPRCIQNVHMDGLEALQGQNYMYPHDYENNYCVQQYLPDDLKNKKYYIPQQNKYEIQMDDYWKKIKNTK